MFGTSNTPKISGNYTLLADENSPYSKDSTFYKAFRAHLIYNIILNDRITFSDNQVMSSPNLRRMARFDGVIRELFKEGRFSLAVRDTAYDGETADMRLIFDAFAIEGKLPKEPGHLAIYDESPELDFIGQYAKFLPWSFAQVGQQFADSCKSIIFNEFRKLVPEHHMRVLETEIAVEEQAQAEKKGKLGRAFLQNEDRLPAILARYGVMPLDRGRSLLMKCTDAAYLSNLPRTIGLNPIYAEEHSASFKLLRSYDYNFEPYGEAKSMENRLDWAHFMEGLNKLDVDDIYKLHETHAYREFSALSASGDIVGRFDELFDAYYELNRLIEDRIIQRFPEIAIASPEPLPQKLQRRFGTVVDKGKSLVMDTLSLGFEIFNAKMMFIPGTIVDMVFDTVKDQVKPDRPFVGGSRHELNMRRLRAHLEERGVDVQTRFEEVITETSSFEKEIIVR